MDKPDFDLRENVKLVDEAKEFLSEGYESRGKQDMPDNVFDLILQLTIALNRTTKHLDVWINHYAKTENSKK